MSLVPRPVAQQTQRVLLQSWRWLQRHRWLAVALIVLGFALAAFAEIADELDEGTLPALDRIILDALRPHRSHLLHELAVHLSELIRSVYMVVLALPFIAYLIYTRRHRVLQALLLVPATAMLMVLVAKLLFSRERPVTAVVEEWGHSFPSGHATGATVVYGLLGYIALRFMTRTPWMRWIVAIITILLIVGTGLARIYLEVHYPSDVAAGWAAGTFILVGTIIALETWPLERGD